MSSDLSAVPEQTTTDDLLSIRTARWLGYAGAAAIPLLVGVGLLIPDAAPLAKRLVAIYGAAILAFLGGIQWGIALGSPVPRIRGRRLVASVVPSLWAVTALTLPMSLCVLALSIGFVAFVAYEILEHSDDVYPAWYLPLRLRLTAAITVGLALSLAL